MTIRYRYKVGPYYCHTTVTVKQNTFLPENLPHSFLYSNDKFLPFYIP